MKKTPQKYKPKNYYISFNMKEKTSPVKIHKNPSSNQLIISEINYDYQNHSKILTKNELFPECISFRDQNIINMEEKLKNFNQNILNQKSQKKDKNNNNINAKKNLSASKNYSFRSKGNKIISFEDFIQILNSNANNNNKNDKNNKIQNIKCNRVKQYDLIITDEKQNQDNMKYFKNKKDSEKQPNKSNKNFQEISYIKSNKIKSKVNSVIDTKNNNNVKDKLLFQLCLESINKNIVNADNEKQYAKTNFIWNYSAKKIKTNNSVFCVNGSDDYDNFITSNKGFKSSRTGNICMNGRYNIQNENSIKMMRQQAFRGNKYIKNSYSDLNHFLYYKKAVETLELFLKEKYFYYFIEKLLLYSTKYLPSNEINLYSKNYTPSPINSNNIIHFNIKYFLPQLLCKESVNSFILKNINSDDKIDIISLENKLKEMLFENKKAKIKNDILFKDNQQLAMKIKNFDDKKPFDNLHIQSIYKLRIESNEENPNLTLKKIAFKILLIVVKNKIKYFLYQTFNQFNDKLTHIKKYSKENIAKEKKQKLKKIIFYKEKFLRKNFMKFYFNGLLLSMKKCEYNFINGGRIIDINDSSYFNIYGNNGVRNAINKLIRLRRIIYIQKNQQLKIIKKYFKIFLTKGIHQQLCFQAKNNYLNSNYNIKEKCFMEELIRERNLVKKFVLKKLIINKEKNVLIIFKSILTKWNFRAKIFGMIEEDKAKKKKRRIQKRINKKNTKNKCDNNNKLSNTNNINRQINPGNSLISTTFSNNFELSNLSQLNIFIQKIGNIFNYKMSFFNLMKKIYESKKNKNSIKENEKTIEDDEIDFDIVDSSIQSDI